MKADFPIDSHAESKVKGRRGLGSTVDDSLARSAGVPRRLGGVRGGTRMKLMNIRD